MRLYYCTGKAYSVSSCQDEYKLSSLGYFFNTKKLQMQSDLSIALIL